MKILFLTDNFPPEVNAPATRTYEHCREWVKSGEKVTVITCIPNFPEGKVYKGYKNKLYQKETIDGIEVIRVWTYIAANRGFIKRIIDYLSFMVMSFFAGLFIKTDLIIATSPQFFTAISGKWLAFWKRKKWVMEIRDLWPESIKAVGAMEHNLVIRYFEFLEKRMYKSAWKIVTVTDSFKAILKERYGVNDSKITVVKNGVNMNLFSPREKDNILLCELEIKNKYIIGYIGTHGMAHALDFVLECASKIKDDEIHFLFLGTGAEKEKLLEQKNKMKLTNVTMLDPVPKHEVGRYISILDAALVNLRKSVTFKTVIPSKIFELAAMHKPILLGVEGESKNLVEKYKIGIPFEPENMQDFIEKVQLIRTRESKEYTFDDMVADFDRTNLATDMLLFIKD
ncbi:glycosyltransferase family 4 protein [Flagellimonas hymeniacidonis]|uniref:Glycosyltransferase family 4 protein n=1 Tax=Flagellimonas hymeniacidonis TaxID=2603628 RepID=A0A5C8V8C4_9FLAO|nr:glycosyltransferase family 4 protein [Flagellimonas hymeniacidonis]TXN37616.1 glycosyltransferase family 4 protein [Flagellimonas hymeniacidonis]